MCEVRRNSNIKIKDYSFNTLKRIKMKLFIYYFVCFYSLSITWNILASGSTEIPYICQGELENGTYTESHNGTVRRYNCSEKHVSNVVGLDKIRFKCDSNSKEWMSINIRKTKSLRDVRCSPIRCAVPSSPENGNVIVNGVYVGDKAVFTCEIGYYWTGSNVWTCQREGKWEGVRAMCRVTASVPPTTKTKTTLTSSGSSVKSKTTTSKTMTKTEQHPSTSPRTTSSISKECLPDIDYMGNYWNQSGPGIETRTNCPEGFVGQVSRLCDKGGVYQTPVYNCTRTELNNILNEVKQADFNATNVLDKLVDATDSYRNTNSSILLGDMDAVNVIMVKIIDSIGRNSTHALGLVDPFLDVTDSMLGENTASSWTIKINQTGEGVNTLLENIDDLIERMFTVTSASNITTTEFQKSNLYLKIGSTASSAGGVSFPDRAIDQKIPEWAENTMDLINVTLNHGENRSYSSVIYKNISNLVPLTAGTSTYRNIPVQIGAPVISFTFHPRDDRKLDTPVLIRFQLFKNSSFDPVCSFWKKENSSSGGYWSSDGCWLASYDEAEGIIECKCDHLTKFAFLLRLSKKLLGKLGIVLSNISMVGCVVSMLELLITIVERVHSWRKAKSKSDNLLKVNLCCTLLVADILFTTGIDQTDYKAACTAVAVLLHFVCLAAFFTTLAQGLCIAYVVIKQSVESREHLITPLAVAVYVISGVTVAVSVGAVQLEGYGTSKFCWLSSESGLIWAFIGPFLGILFINIVITPAVVCRNRKNVTGLQTSDKENVKADLRNLMVLMPVMGLTWVFGVLSIADDQILFQYLFAIFNVFQGFLIFIFNCCVENKYQKACRRYKSRIWKQFKSSESEESPSECAIDDDHGKPLELSIRPLNTTTKDI